MIAIYKQWTVQSDPKLMHTSAPAEDAPKIEVRGKDEWADEYGMKIAVNKVSYRLRF